MHFHLPGWVGCCMTIALGGTADLPCQAGLRPHSRTAFGNSLGDSPPKSLSLCDFLTLGDACVNGKNKESSGQQGVCGSYLGARNFKGSVAGVGKLSCQICSSASPGVSA